MTATDPRWPGVFMSVVRSLWGMVTPDLRWVSVGLHAETVVARFVYEAPPDEEREWRVSVAETEVIADWWPELRVDFQARHQPWSQDPHHEDGTYWFALVRWEPVRVPDVLGLSLDEALRALRLDRDRLRVVEQDTQQPVDLAVADRAALVVGTAPCAGEVLTDEQDLVVYVQPAGKCR